MNSKYYFGQEIKTPIRLKFWMLSMIAVIVWLAIAIDGLNRIGYLQINSPFDYVLFVAYPLAVIVMSGIGLNYFHRPFKIIIVNLVTAFLLGSVFFVVGSCFISKFFLQ